jgi:hypothetical protein
MRQALASRMRLDFRTKWAREELNLRPHAYQAVSPGTGIRRETDNSLIGLATCRDSPTKGGRISDSNRDTTATDYSAAGASRASMSMEILPRAAGSGQESNDTICAGGPRRNGKGCEAADVAHLTGLHSAQNHAVAESCPGANGPTPSLEVGRKISGTAKTARCGECRAST